MSCYEAHNMSEAVYKKLAERMTEEKVDMDYSYAAVHSGGPAVL